MCEFAETVLFHYADEGATKTTINWDYGIWLGRCTQSDEHFVGTSLQVYRTTSIRRLPKADRYNKELLESITSTPWSTRGIGKGPTTDFVLPLPEKQQLREQVVPDQPVPDTTPASSSGDATNAGASSSSASMPAGLQPRGTTRGLDEPETPGLTTKSRRIGEASEELPSS